ncbi:hypothetical protein V8C37DRAFT_364206 [Trichoderma ceciliae]
MYEAGSFFYFSFFLSFLSKIVIDLFSWVVAAATAEFIGSFTPSNTVVQQELLLFPSMLRYASYEGLATWELPNWEFVVSGHYQNTCIMFPVA